LPSAVKLKRHLPFLAIKSPTTRHATLQMADMAVPGRYLGKKFCGGQLPVRRDFPENCNVGRRVNACGVQQAPE